MSLSKLERVFTLSGRQWKTRKPSVLEFMGLQRVGCDWLTEQQQQQNLEKPGQDRMISMWVDLSRARLDHSWPWWCPTQPHKSLGTLSCAPLPVSGCFSFNGSTYNFGSTNGKESDSQAGDARDSGSISGSGNPLQYSCLENTMDRGAWQATIHEVAKSQTWLSDWAQSTESFWIGCFEILALHFLQAQR